MEFDSIIVNRLPIRELSVKLRSAGQTALELLQRKRHLQISAILLCDLMDLNGDDDASSDDEIEEEYGLKRGLGRRTEDSVVGARKRGTREDVVRRVNVMIIGYS